MSETKILFLTHPYPNYVPDLLLHGLRKLLGPNVVLLLAFGLYTAGSALSHLRPAQHQEQSHEHMHH